jgi:7-cyano-7-deazaguanine reductase
MSDQTENVAPDGAGVPGDGTDVTPVPEGPKPVLGREVRTPLKQLDVFPNPGVQVVTMEAVEFTSLCPVTGQPDSGSVSIQYIPKEWCLESKSLKLYLWTFRERGVFCESLAQEIAATISKVLKPVEIQVTVQQAPRGGIGVRALARITEPAPPPVQLPKGGDLRRLLRPRHK